MRVRTEADQTLNDRSQDRGDRFPRDAAAVAAGVLLVLAGYELSIVLPRAVGLGAPLGVDFHQYLSQARHFLDTGGFYLERQLHGPYVIESGDPLYPPAILYILIPFLVIPHVLWWIVPLGLIAAVVITTMPKPWAWPLLALIVADPRTIEIVIYGNPAMWVAAAVAGAVLWSWPGAFVLLKPSLAPFALVGIRSRGWWITLAVIAVVSAPLVGLYVQFVRVLLDSNGSWFYSLPDAPFVALPLVAWLARTRDPQLRLANRFALDAHRSHR
jgi:hypothetical protein